MWLHGQGNFPAGVGQSGIGETDEEQSRLSTVMNIRKSLSLLLRLGEQAGFRNGNTNLLQIGLDSEKRCLCPLSNIYIVPNRYLECRCPECRIEWAVLGEDPEAANEEVLKFLKTGIRK